MKITLIQTFQHGVALHTSEGKIGFENIQEAIKYAKDKDLSIEIRHVHPGGINGSHLSESHKNVS